MKILTLRLFIFLCYILINSSVNLQCIAPSCIRAAARMLSNMDDSVAPCDDFYKFACGNFDERYALFDAVDVGLLEGLKHRRDVKSLVRDVLTSDAPDMQNLRNFHSSCINADLSYPTQVKIVRKILSEIGDWPLINENFDDTSFDWIQRSLKLIDRGLLKSAFFNLGINTDDSAPPYAVKSLKVFFPILWDEFNLVLNNKSDFSNHELDSTNNVFFMLYLKSDENDEIFSDASSLVDEIKKSVQCKMSYDRSVRIKDFYNISETFNWLSFINDQFSPHQITDNDFVRVENCTYKTIPDLINILNSTPQRTIATLMLIRIATELFTEFKSYSSQWILQKRGMKTDRLNKCLHTEFIYFPLHLSKLYYDKFISNSTTTQVSKMMGNLFRQLRSDQNKADWLLNKTRIRIGSLLKTVRSSFTLPSPSAYYNITTKLAELVNLTEDNFINNLLELSKARIKLRLHKMKKDYDYFFSMFLFGHNIKKLSAHLIINFIGASPSLFREPFFHKDYPSALNYGSLGFMFGHELMHSINKYFIELSTVARRDNISHKAFMNKAKCIVVKNADLVIKELKMKYSPNFTFSDDLADVDGIRLAYKSYRKLSPEYNSGVIGLNFTENQLFWLSVANTFCRVDNPHTWKTVSNSSHSHQRIRVWSMVSNSPDFSTDFNCPENSPMNRQPKCPMWVTD